MSKLAHILFILVSLTAGLGAHIADWNETHVFNPRWPPHAKFHNGQTMSMGIVLGLTPLYFLYKPLPQSVSSASVAVQREFRLRALYTAAWIACIYWVTQLTASLYPGTLPMDPEFGDGFPQLYICAATLSMVGVGTYLERKSIYLMGGRKKK